MYRGAEAEPPAGGITEGTPKPGVMPVGVDWAQEASAVPVHHLAEKVTAELKLPREVTVRVVLASEVPETFGALRKVGVAEMEKSL